VKWRRDHRFPNMDYWRGGAFPDGVEVVEDYARADPVTA
jgi:hypothetical protein